MVLLILCILSSNTEDVDPARCCFFRSAACMSILQENEKNATKSIYKSHIKLSSKNMF
jgi:hypothetical protein